jgi:predicted GNAT family acetyltransferase
MQFHTFSSAQEFLHLVQPALEADESANGLMYGLALRIRDQPERFEPPIFLSAVSAAGSLRAAALMTPPHNLVVLSVDPSAQAEAFALIARRLLADGWSVPGVVGPNQPALAFAQAWRELTGRAYTLAMHERVYKLSQVVPPPQPPGFMRPALEADCELVAQWLEDFRLEAVPADPPVTPEKRLANARVRIAERSFYLWQDGVPVALAGWTRPTPHGCSVGPVYTPREYRRQGYAGVLTAALSQFLLDQGKQFTSLFTDLSNPTSNSIYQKIGYQPVCDFDLYRFSQD